MTTTSHSDDPLYQSIREPDTYWPAYNQLMDEPPNRLRVRAVGEIRRSIPEPLGRVVDIACGGGYILGLLRATLTGTTWLGWDPTHVRFYDERSPRAKLYAAGFETVAFNGTYYLPFHLPARILSWPLDRAGFTRAARSVYNAVQLPGYALNYPFEALSETGGLSTLGWGIVVLARWKGTQE